MAEALARSVPHRAELALGHSLGGLVLASAISDVQQAANQLLLLLDGVLVSGLCAPTASPPSVRFRLSEPFWTRAVRFRDSAAPDATPHTRWERIGVLIGVGPARSASAAGGCSSRRRPALSASCVDVAEMDACPAE